MWELSPIQTLPKLMQNISCDLRSLLETIKLFVLDEYLDRGNWRVLRLASSANFGHCLRTRYGSNRTPGRLWATFLHLACACQRVLTTTASVLNPLDA